MLRTIQELLVTGSICFRAGMIGALAAALLLTGCGRKGPLDPPPGASGLQSGAPAQAPSATDPAGPPARGMQKDFDDNGRPIAPTGQKQRLFLDWLLD
jgi:predicted small lipoprotein YifL